MTLAERIRQAREGRELSQEALARLVDVTTKTVGRWEGGAKPSVEVVSTLADKLHVDLRWLLTGEGKGPAEEAA